MFRPLKRLNLGNLVPLPGVGELEGAMKGLVDTLKSSGYKNEQCDLITTRFERLLAILRPAGQLESVQPVLRQLGDIKNAMESGLKRRLPASFSRAQHQLEVLDTARSQINDLITDALLQLSVAREMESSNQTRKRRFEENLRVIPEYEIANQELVRSVTTRTILGGQTGGLSFETSNNTEDSVTICHRIGYLGNLRVFYRTFNSRSDNAAAERTEMELKVLSKALHPSIATLVGVTRGYYGLNGVVVAMAGLPWGEFVLKPVSGAVLVRCLKEFQEVTDLLRSCHFGEHIDDYLAEDVNFDHNGHVTVLPRLSGDTLGSYGLELHPVKHKQQWYRYTNSANQTIILNIRHIRTSAALASVIYCGMVRAAAGIFSRPARRVMRQIKGFTSRLSELDTGFTKLDVIRIAAEQRIDPTSRIERLQFNCIPPFTLMHGDVVFPVATPGGKREWRVFRQGIESTSVNSIHGWARTGFLEVSRVRSLGDNQEYSTWLVGQCGDLNYIGIHHQVVYTTWRDVVRNNKLSQKCHWVDSDIRSFCSGTTLFVRIRRPKSEENTNHSRPLYSIGENLSQRGYPRVKKAITI